MTSAINLNNPILDSIPAEAVKGYRIVRSFFNNTKFCINAVDYKGNILVCVANELDFEQASALVETLNAPHEIEVLHELQETELVEVKVQKEDRIFTALRVKASV